MIFINHNSLKSDIFFNPILIPCFPGSIFFRVQVFLGPGFSKSRFFTVQVFLVRIFQGPALYGSRFFRACFQGPGPGFRSSQIFWHFLVLKKLITSCIKDSVTIFFYFQPTLNRLFNNCTNLYWYEISSFWNMKGEVKLTPLSSPRKKLPLKSPASLVLNILQLPYENTSVTGLTLLKRNSNTSFLMWIFQYV